MKITVELPDDVGLRPDPGREALEALAIEGYRAGALTHQQPADCSAPRGWSSTLC
jgi:hypothetical protein